MIPRRMRDFNIGKTPGKSRRAQNYDMKKQRTVGSSAGAGRHQHARETEGTQQPRQNVPLARRSGTEASRQRRNSCVIQGGLLLHRGQPQGPLTSDANRQSPTSGAGNSQSNMRKLVVARNDSESAKLDEPAAAARPTAPNCSHHCREAAPSSRASRTFQLAIFPSPRPPPGVVCNHENDDQREGIDSRNRVPIWGATRALNTGAVGNWEAGTCKPPPLRERVAGLWFPGTNGFCVKASIALGETRGSSAPTTTVYPCRLRNPSSESIPLLADGHAKTAPRHPADGASKSRPRQFQIGDS